MIQRLYKTYRKSGFGGVQAGIARRISQRLHPPFNPLPLALKEIFKNPDFPLIQIGAYIGNSENDPLFERVGHELRTGRGRLIALNPSNNITTLESKITAICPT